MRHDTFNSKIHLLSVKIIFSPIKQTSPNIFNIWGENGFKMEKGGNDFQANIHP